MFKRFTGMTVATMGLAAALSSVGEVHAQCSGGRGGRGGPSTSSPTTFGQSVSTSSPNAFAYQQALMQQQQMYAMQQRMQMMAMQQLVQRKAESQFEKQQKLVAARLERAAQKRLERAEKIAALKAKRDAIKLDADPFEGTAPPAVRFASTNSASGLAQAASSIPFALRDSVNETN